MQQRAADDSASPGAELAKQLARRALRSPRVRVGALLWALGLFFMLLAPGLYQVTPETKAAYERMVIGAANLPEYHEAAASHAQAQMYADEAKVWFWRFREPHKSIVHERQQVADKWAAALADAEARREKQMKEAKAMVGLWSDFGLSEARERFWSAFDKGKLFAQQQTFYHMIMRVLSARDEDVISTVLNWIVVAVMNFTTGLVGSVFYYAFSLMAMVWSYSPDPLSAAAFFAIGLIGAASVVASYLLAMYGMVASGAYVVGKMVVRDAIEQERQRQQYLRQGQQY